MVHRSNPRRKGYAREEFVAELGAPSSAPISASRRRSGTITRPTWHWLDVRREDKRAIFNVAAHAQRAADYLNGLQEKQREAAA
jgi:antirestriction protein ArdC